MQACNPWTQIQAGTICQLSRCVGSRMGQRASGHLLTHPDLVYELNRRQVHHSGLAFSGCRYPGLNRSVCTALWLQRTVQVDPAGEGVRSLLRSSDVPGFASEKMPERSSPQVLLHNISEQHPPQGHCTADPPHHRLMNRGPQSGVREEQ
ncbi:hypothetical protein AOLI_G00252210 [Acnodon oligacanthus]